MLGVSCSSVLGEEVESNGSFIGLIEHDRVIGFQGTVPYRERGIYLHFFILCMVVFLPGQILGDSDSSAGRAKVEVVFHFGGTKDGPASVVLHYGVRGEQIVEIDVTWQGKTIKIPKAEIQGIPDIKISSLDLKSGGYPVGTPGHEEGGYYHYVDALYGKYEPKSVEGYKRVWFLIEGDYVERKTFINERSPDKMVISIHRSIARKLRGKVEVVEDAAVKN